MADSERAPLFTEGPASTLALVGYIAAAVVLMVADRRGDYLSQLRSAFLNFCRPLYTVAEWPAVLGRTLTWHLSDRASLESRNAELEQALLLAETQLTELRARDAEASRMRSLVDFAARTATQGKVARLINVDVDAYSHRIVIDKGRAEGVEPGSVLFDGQGIAGQVIELGQHTALAMLISHPEHAVPVELERSGLRGIAYGNGRLDRLSIDDLPTTADVREGDVVRTSGLGGRFPAGFMVGTVQSLEREAGAAFTRATLAPAARLGLIRELMLLPPVTYEDPAQIASGEASPEPTAGATPEADD